jgi:hypothetical protein
LPAQLLKAACVDHLIGDLKDVTGWTGDDFGLGAKGPTQSRKMALEDPKGVCGGVVAPQLVAESVSRDD